MMKHCQLAKEDRISALPSNIIELILMCLPLKEAVRTSILSSRWRYQWCTIPHLIFDDQTISPASSYKLESVVDRILLFHIGPIHKFVIEVNVRSGIKDRWLVFLSQKNLKELTLACYRCKSCIIPAALYSCHALESLYLFFGRFKLPSCFNGFSCLTTLVLECVRISYVDFASLVSKCPILRKLVFFPVYYNFHFKLNAPKLQELMIAGQFVDIHLENMSELVSFSLGWEHGKTYKDGECYFNKCLSNIPKIEILELRYDSLYIMTTGAAFVRFPTYSCLKKVILSCFYFEDQELLNALGSLLQNTPVLKELELKVFEPINRRHVASFYDWKESRNFNLGELQIVRLSHLRGVQNEMDFIEFILYTASRLESLMIELHVKVTEKIKFYKEIIRFRRSSPRAEVVILDRV